MAYNQLLTWTQISITFSMPPSAGIYTLELFVSLWLTLALNFPGRNSDTYSNKSLQCAQKVGINMIMVME